MVEGNKAFVIYEAEQISGLPFRNPEFLHVRNGQIHEVEVYLGWNMGKPRKAQVHKRGRRTAARDEIENVR